jgi:hypothetical protein
MRLERLGWSVVASSALAAVFATAAFALGDEGQTHNGLSSEALRRNALTTNRESLKKLLEYPLNDDLFARDGGYILQQLGDPKALAVMQELVECALTPQTAVTAKDPGGNVIGAWHGELGLCQRWHTSGLKESEECQELVTACLMSRVNGLRKSVPLSLRGEPRALFPLRDQVLTDVRYRESPDGHDPSEGTPIASFLQSCPPGDDCRWAPAHVGTCRAGRVTLQVPAGSGAKPLRVCTGIHGCLGATAPTPVNPGDPPPPPPPPYSRPVPQAPGVSPSTIDFDCPTGVQVGGYYSIMIQSGASQPDTIQQIGESGRYPAKEQEVFTFREGAFYGNLFEPDELTTSCEVYPTVGQQGLEMSCKPPGGKGGDSNVCRIDRDVIICERKLGPLPYKDVHACYSVAQEQDSQYGELGVAYLNSRICDQPDSKASCFFHPPRPCSGGNHSARCKWSKEAGVYQDCEGLGARPRTFRPITTYLNDPCDLIGEQGLCAKIRALRPIDPSPSSSPGCWGCTRSCSAGGALVLAPGVALLALILRRRPRRHRG